MDELKRALWFGLLFVLVGCTVRERTAYEDCVRARCSPGQGSCERIGVDDDAGLGGVRVCTKSCETDDECPDDERTGLPGRCVTLGDDATCLPTCAVEYDCFAPLRCALSEGVCMPDAI
jgi:hypothetical protein